MNMNSKVIASIVGGLLMLLLSLDVGGWHAGHAVLGAVWGACSWPRCGIDVFDYQSAPTALAGSHIDTTRWDRAAVRRLPHTHCPTAVRCVHQAIVLANND